MDNENNFEEDYIEIDLREYLYILWKNKWVILGIVLLSIIISYSYTAYVLNPVYESEAVIMTPNFELVNEDTFNRTEYISFLKNDEVGNKIKEEYYSNDKYESITLTNIYDKLEINTNSNNRNVTLLLKESNPNRANNILSTWISEFKTTVNNNIDNINQNYLNRIENKLDEDYKNYQNALDEYTTFTQNNNINLLKNRLSSKENRIVSLETNLSEIQNQIINNKAELETVISQLENTKQFYIQREQITEDSLRKLQSINPNNELISLLTSENEILNPQYNYLIDKKNNFEQSLTSLETRYSNYKEDIKTLDQEIEELQNTISKLEEEKELLDNKLENNKEIYNTTKENYNESQERLINSNNQITTLNTASTPSNPSSPNLKLNLAIAAVLGLFLAIFIIFIKEFLKGTDWQEYESE